MQKLSLILIILSSIVVGCEGDPPTNPQTQSIDNTHSDNITADEVWSSGAPHIIEKEIFIQRAVIRIEPGAIIRFKNGAGISVMEAGGIIADGTNSKIQFKLATGEQGYWKNIYFAGNVNADSCRLINCLFEYGGSDTTWPATIYCQKSAPTIQSCTIRNSATNGIYLGGDCSGGNFDNNIITQNNGVPIVAAACNVPAIGDGQYTGNSKDAIKVIMGTINTDAIWSDAGLPYWITDHIRIKRATLGLMPGTKLNFATKNSLVVEEHARLETYGNVVFSSADTTADFWGGIIFMPSSAGRLKNCLIEYGGNDSDHPANLTLNQAMPTIENCQIRGSLTYGVYLSGDMTAISFKDNTITKNNGAPISIGAGNIRILSDNSYTGNSDSYIEVRGGDPEGIVDNSIVWFNFGLPYRIMGDVTVSGAVTQIMPGTVLQMGMNSQINVINGGGFIADGTNNPIEIAGLSHYPGAWNCIHFSETSNDNNCLLKNCIIRYGGGSSQKPANIYMKDSSPTISHCTISYSLNYGIYLDGSSAPVLLNNSFLNNMKGAKFP